MNHSIIVSYCVGWSDYISLSGLTIFLLAFTSRMLLKTMVKLFICTYNYMERGPFKQISWYCGHLQFHAIDLCVFDITHVFISHQKIDLPACFFYTNPLKFIPATIVMYMFNLSFFELRFAFQALEMQNACICIFWKQKISENTNKMKKISVWCRMKYQAVWGSWIPVTIGQHS